MRTSHELVDPRDARAGDVVFFDTRSRGEEDLDCSDRVGLIESVDAAGRITFLESRGGQLYRGYVDPRQPLTRRDERGEIANSFLRPKRLDDPDGTRYFAGEMLCGIARMRGHDRDRTRGARTRRLATVNHVEANANKVVGLAEELLRSCSLTSRSDRPRHCCIHTRGGLSIADCMIAVQKRSPYNRPVFQAAPLADFSSPSLTSPAPSAFV